MFKSFLIGGFECSTGYNVHEQWFDQVQATQHDRFAAADYMRLAKTGIRTARDGVRWPLVDRGRGYDFSSLRPILEASRQSGVEVIFDLFHFGYPDGLDLLSPRFPQRFAEYCYATTRFLHGSGIAAPLITPVNEPSYFAWAAGEAACFAPHWRGRAAELKRALAAAAIAGVEACWSACRAVRIVSVDPICHVVAPADNRELEAEARRFNDSVVFESWDMISGHLAPELGGSPRHLGTLGINYYWTNQWELGCPYRPLDAADPRRCNIRDLLRKVWLRYGRDMLISETSQVDELRPIWLRELAGEVAGALEEGMPLRGVCIYPVLGMPEWHDRDRWSRMGLWDLIERDGILQRIPYQPALNALQELRKAALRTPATARCAAAG